MACNKCGNEGIRCKTTQTLIISALGFACTMALQYPKVAIKALVATVSVIIAVYLWDNEHPHDTHSHTDSQHDHSHDDTQEIDAHEVPHVDYTG